MEPNEALTTIQQSLQTGWPQAIEERRVRLLTLAFDVLENALTDKSSQRWAADKIIEIFKPLPSSSPSGPNFNMINLGPGGLDTAIAAIRQLTSGKLVDASKVDSNE